MGSEAKRVAVRCVFAIGVVCWANFFFQKIANKNCQEMITAKVNELIESRGPRRGGRPVESEAEAVLGPCGLAAETLEGMMPSS